MSIFDSFTDRKGSGNSKWNIEEGMMPMHVADMDFDSPKEVCEAIIERAKTGIFGYQNYTDEYYDAVCGWFKRRHGVEMSKEQFIISPGIVSFVCRGEVCVARGQLNWLVRELDIYVWI